MKYLPHIDTPKDLRTLPEEALSDVSIELRHFILEKINQIGGHLGAALGTVELSVALHYVFDTPRDRVVWDVGHQGHGHKILTGRRDAFHTLKQEGGLSGFLKRTESPYDTFGAGHASTSISAALGMREGLALKNSPAKTVAVIGDGGLTGGMAFEALNHAGAIQDRGLVVVLNDNGMSISPNVGALSHWFSDKMVTEPVAKLRRHVRGLLSSFNGVGNDIITVIERAIGSTKAAMLPPSMLFEGMGFEYVGPVDGHNVSELVKTLQRTRKLDRPVLVHIRTEKGKGCPGVEGDLERKHAVKPNAINLDQVKASEKENTTRSNATYPSTTKIVNINDASSPSITSQSVTNASAPTYTTIFGDTLCKIANADPRVVAVTAAMCQGTGLTKFAEKFPGRFYDVGIAEQHGVTFAAGLATEGFRPVAAIYSTFLQRAFDQMIHDVALQQLPVTFCLDRAGLVGADGPTHHGVFDLSYARMIPNLSVAVPRDENQLQHLLLSSVRHEGPACIRYPRGAGVGVDLDTELSEIAWGKAEVLTEQGSDLVIVGMGPLVYEALKASKELSKNGVKATVIDARFLKPMDEKLLLSKFVTASAVITIEDNQLAGGFGSAVLELCADNNLTPKIKRLGIPDKFIDHGSVKNLYRSLGLDAEGIVSAYNNLTKSTGRSNGKSIATQHHFA